MKKKKKKNKSLLFNKMIRSEKVIISKLQVIILGSQLKIVGKVIESYLTFCYITIEGHIMNSIPLEGAAPSVVLHR